MGYVRSVNVGQVRVAQWAGRLGRTGIDKRPVDGPVRFEESGVRGDGIADTEHHGAWYQAAYAFDVADLHYWSAELGRELQPGNAGENLSMADCDVSEAVLGQRWRIGSAVLRVTGPRTPCKVFAGFWEAPGLVKRFTAYGRPGAYLAVEVPGEIAAGDRCEVLSTPEHGVTVGEVFRFRMQRRTELADHVLRGVDDLPPKWRDELARTVSAG